MTSSPTDHGRRASQPSDIPKAGWKDVARRVKDEIKADQVPVVAAGVAFYAWLALIPAMLAVVMVYGLVTDAEQVTRQIEAFTSSLSPEASQMLVDVVTNATSGDAGGLTAGVAIGLLGVLWSASGGMDGLIKGINIAYDEEPRSFPKRRGLAVLLTLGAIVVGGLAVGLITAFPAFVDRLDLGLGAMIGAQVVRWATLLVLVLLGLAVLYRVAPHREDARLRWTTPGALVAGVTWLLGSAGFAVYVRTFGSYDATYGALAGVVILNLWLFLTSFVVLLGAEINAEVEAQTRHDTTTGDPEPMGQRGAVKADHLGEVNASR